MINVFVNGCNGRMGKTVISQIENFDIKLQIWDTCGLEEFSSCTPSDSGNKDPISQKVPVSKISFDVVKTLAEAS
mgnify:CR=1 FL=1